ncbi:hypothetical protein IV203_012785 [Nitzschia inconspicua]|uniref:Uncharacterized protein n=1 Tax=Nitzschia inconspicua TaxID=303405 RepID=A0A9K3Q884_9STRA|nr:hypothetical protein IV203_012765 [Nitzschia inconspicua]KAG7350048.1 hypothetical protein IV203_012645 [Nitzschia inconspicua]KAG7373690.1 hypothetical protein IV203_012785 [Nitzschia inconspicua]
MVASIEVGKRREAALGGKESCEGNGLDVQRCHGTVKKRRLKGADVSGGAEKCSVVQTVGAVAREKYTREELSKVGTTKEIGHATPEGYAKFTGQHWHRESGDWIDVGSGS